MQATNSLILKAVADAQKSVINHPPKITEPEIKSPSALFTRKYREKGLNTETVAITITNSSVRQHNDESSMDIDHHTSRNVGHTEMESDEMIHTLTEVPEPMGSQVELSFDAQPIETRFIVTLDGAHSLMSQRFEEELNEDETKEVKEISSAKIQLLEKVSGMEDEHYDFIRGEEKAKRMTEDELNFAIKDLKETIDIQEDSYRKGGHTPKLGYYHDELHTYLKELNKRNKQSPQAKMNREFNDFEEVRDLDALNEPPSGVEF